MKTNRVYSLVFVIVVSVPGVRAPGLGRCQTYSDVRSLSPHKHWCRLLPAPVGANLVSTPLQLIDFPAGNTRRARHCKLCLRMRRFATGSGKVLSFLVLTIAASWRCRMMGKPRISAFVGVSTKKGTLWHPHLSWSTWGACCVCIEGLVCLTHLSTSKLSWLQPPGADSVLVSAKEMFQV